MDPKFLTHHLNILYATRYYAFKSKDPKDIADALCVKPSKVQDWMNFYEWLEALGYWSQAPKQGDFNIAERRWTEMIQNHEHLSPVDYPDIPGNLSHSQEILEVSALIQSHLFCVDNLTEDEIQERLANENNDGMKPIRYEGQDLENAYYWWIFPNKPEGLYSKVLARANVVGDIVIGSGDDTSLVVIRHGRLTLTRQFCDDVANVSDERLLVCL